MLLIGTFVEAGYVDGTIRVGRIVGTSTSDSALVCINVFPRLFPIPPHEGQHLPITAGPGQLMVELFQGTEIKEWPRLSIRKIAFVFPASSEFHCGGKNSFVIRFRKDVRFSEFPFHETLIPSQHPVARLLHRSCYVQRVYVGLKIITGISLVIASLLASSDSMHSCDP
jgi:hypothetical protein